jgi:nucleotide-binding universal stress UspA family protein
MDYVAAGYAAVEDQMFCPVRILVPVDFSGSAMPAVRCASDLARMFGARVHLLHVAPEPAAQGWAAGVSIADLEAQADEWRGDAMDELSAFAALAAPPGTQRLGRLGPTLAVRVSDDAPAAILAYARDADCDLIVMGTHRASKFALLRGGTADWVRRHASCPVLLVPPPAEADAARARRSGDLHAEFAVAQ